MQVKLTVTGLLFQPFEFGPGDFEPDIVGPVSSILTITETEIDRPAPFVALQVIVVPDVSACSTVVPHPVEETMPDSGSETVQLTVTSPLFHPLGLGEGVAVGVITGAEPSMIIVTVPLSAKSPTDLAARTLNVYVPTGRDEVLIVSVEPGHEGVQVMVGGVNEIAPDGIDGEELMTLRVAVKVSLPGPRVTVIE